MMRKRNKGKKALTAASAVVTAGLTPGIITATPACMPSHTPNSLITAAEVVTIDGNTYSFDELYAMQQPDSVDTAVDLPEVQVTGYQHVTKYGGPLPSIRYNPDLQPQFPGGEAALTKYIESHIQYPANAVKNKIQGQVVVRVVVKENGEIGDVTVVRSVDKDLDEEAVRVVKSLPKFTPGYRQGKPMLMFVTIPVLFKLPEENSH